MVKLHKMKRSFFTDSCIENIKSCDIMSLQENFMETEI